MRITIVCLLTLIAGCKGGERHANATADTARFADSVVATVRTPSEDTSSPPVMPKDSIGILAYEDSVIGHLPIGRAGIVAPNGDTLRALGYGFLQDSSAEDYSFRYYSRNSDRYIRVVRRTSNGSGGRPTRSTASRLRLPAIAPTDHLVMEGYCMVNGKDAPLIVAITGTAGDSVYWHAHHAWRLDTGSGILREIPATGIMCRHVSGEE